MIALRRRCTGSAPFFLLALCFCSACPGLCGPGALDRRRSGRAATRAPSRRFPASPTISISAPPTVGSTSRWTKAPPGIGLAKLDASDDLVLDHIVVDSAESRHDVCGRVEAEQRRRWIVGEPRRRAGAGAELPGLHGQSIRAFVQAPSDPDMLFAGTLQGVFRSSDAARPGPRSARPAAARFTRSSRWPSIRPTLTSFTRAPGTCPGRPPTAARPGTTSSRASSTTLTCFPSSSIPTQPRIVYVSACSGIYKSENAGVLFRKIQGIPSTARRTRVLQAGPGEPRGCVRRNHRGSLQDRQRRQEPSSA